MSYWRSNITCRAIEIVSGFVQDALQPSELIVTGRRHVRLLVTPELFFFIRRGEGPCLSDYICKFNKIEFFRKAPPPPAAEL